ncbi:MAG: ATP-binding cassette domain-containing protein [Propionicimonas sp.]|uniref:metal ABC transporter ATP-binding protein n=1 Tax=Propionicimonas sp. TaxID=1955623 RepID=UPI002B2208DF|nr:ATP-binding cassette domain-containing protein [Propionicimonas sp.]MEA4943410.1 ATP-binding cassette domain-containing protein [Propionicimonas sp.]MEA5054972.1 ATP-binding cassette domain-containing protein [Propionicimonas sp.]
MRLNSEQAPGPAAIRAAGLGVLLGGVPIVRDVDLEIAQGEAVAILGNNGSGKTTLMRALIGLIPHRGEIELFGTRLQDFRDWNKLGYVPQRSGILVQQATAREVVASGRLGHRRAFWPETPADRQAIAAALEAVDLTDRARHRFVRLSGGQQQRVLIARALASGAQLMLWDEPLAGVDHVTQKLLADVARTLIADGVTVVMVLHELGPFAEVIDRAIFVQDGRVLPHVPDPGHHHGGHEMTELAATRPRPHQTGLEAL